MIPGEESAMGDHDKHHKDELEPEEILDAIEQLYLAEVKIARDQKDAKRSLVRDIAARGVSDPASVIDRWTDISDREDNLEEPRQALVELIQKMSPKDKSELAKLLSKRLVKRFDDIVQMELDRGL